VVITELIYCFF